MPVIFLIEPADAAGTATGLAGHDDGHDKFLLKSSKKARAFIGTVKEEGR